MSSTIKVIAELLLGLLKGLLGIFIYRAGKDNVRLDNAEKTINDVAKGNIAASTNEYDKQLRDRYNK